jgi:tetratricopeptide (TPR) repeat protein
MKCTAAQITELMNEGIEHHIARRFDQAVGRYSRVAETVPDYGDAWRLLGVVALQTGDNAAARRLLKRAIRIDPKDAAAYSALGSVNEAEGKLDEAYAAYATACAIDQTQATAFVGFTRVANGLGRATEVIAMAGPAVARGTVDAGLLREVGAAHLKLGNYAEAEAPLLASLRMAPHADAYANLSITYVLMHRADAAIEAFEKALELDPAHPALTGEQAYCNIGVMYQAAGRSAKAISAYEAALALRPDFAEAHTNLAYSLLVCGDFARGWEEYAWIWRRPATRSSYPYFDRATVWNGEPFAGRELLITREHGFGDAIQMARYLPAVKARGGRVVLEVSPALLPLFSSLPDVDELRAVDDVSFRRNDVDLFVPLMGLPRAFGTDVTSIPAPIPYLRASDERVEIWRPRLDSPAPLRVGIVWAGNPKHPNDRYRSCDLDDFAPLGALKGIAWFGLQKGRDEERRSCGPLTLDPLGVEIGDFADTAAILTHLDLVIAVDTSIVHLAGAMGKPVWTLLPFSPDWRWMIERGDSPWYPTMRLFRQPRVGDWAPVVAEVARELDALRTK